MNLRVAVAVSGGGRSLENLLNSEFKSFSVCAVIASNSKCRGVHIAKQHDLPIFIHDFKPEKAPAKELYTWLETLEIDLVALAGFLKKFPVRSDWSRRVVNIHPSLLPQFGGKGMYGLRVHQAAITAKAEFSGATVHAVNAEYDDGPVISQISVPVLPQDTPESLADRVFKAECILYPTDPGCYKPSLGQHWLCLSQ